MSPIIKRFYKYHFGDDFLISLDIYTIAGSIFDDSIVFDKDGNFYKVFAITLEKAWFIPSGDGCTPDFNDIEIIDNGLTLRLGKYEVGSDSILEALKERYPNEAYLSIEQ